MTEEIRGMTSNIELREDAQEEAQFIEGYALKFNTWSEDLGGFRETIKPEALSDTDFSDVRALFNHNADQVLARTSAGTLKLDVDKTGLKFKAKIPNTSYGRDLLENLRNGNVNQCSFGFILDEDGDTFERSADSGLYNRTLNDIKAITDVSVVTYPAYKDTEVAPALRSIDRIERAKEQKRIAEKLRLKLNLL